GQPISTFGAIKHKLGEMAARIYGVESLVYRTAGAIQGDLDREAADQQDTLKVLERYAIEASIAKVSASEMLDFVLDENIQVHGGNGFVSDYRAERYYRDARVNRIFEGTNEINRLLIGTRLARAEANGEVEWTGGPARRDGVPHHFLADESTAVDEFRLACLS